MPQFPDSEGVDTGVLVEKKPRLKKPPLFKVVLHNDDFTTMDFVVFVLQHIFGRSEPEAVAIMLAVHRTGAGVAGIYPYEIAKMKADKATTLARSREYPLLCTVEKA